MDWTIGEWKILKEGEIHQSLKKCINLLLKHEMSLTLKFDSKGEEIKYGREIYEFLRTFEKEHGVKDLLKVLASGLNMEAKKGEEEIEIKTIMRIPSVSEERQELFMDVITAWVEENALTFSERFFRLPKISEDIADRYLDNPLEQTLKRTFGFHFQYKLIITCKRSTSKLEGLRKELYPVVR
ncbi:hypothetical protein KAW08_04130 [bacterium]|nr:hypothetical protein [bacterium]